MNRNLVEVAANDRAALFSKMLALGREHSYKGSKLASMVVL